jgi:hypothetical protein
MVSRFTLVDIRLVWDRIKPDIEKLRSAWSFDWRPEDIYAQCLMGRAFCYLCEDGFVIVQPRENPYSLAKELFVWVCVSHAKDGVLEYNRDISELAKEINATAIIFSSPREGFKKMAQQQGWRSMTEYTIPVN